MKNPTPPIGLSLLFCAVFFLATLSIGCSKPSESHDQKPSPAPSSAANENASTSVQSDDDALVEAAYSGDAQTVRRLLDRNPSTKAIKKALLAVSRNSVLLIRSPDSANPSKKSGTETEDLDKPFGETARALIEHGAKVNFRDDNRATPLILAAEHGRTSIVRVLLAKGALVDVRDKDGDTALIAAACECPSIDMPETLDSLKLLVAKGADVNAANSAGSTALLQAARWARTENMKFLLEKGADVDVQDNYGNSALIISAEGSGIPTAEATRLLLGRGANTELKDRNGETALMLAASKGGFDAIENVRLLLRGGADIRATNKLGQMALDLARKNHRKETAAILSKAMAESHPLEGERAP